jgi:hypothetical protein
MFSMWLHNTQDMSSSNVSMWLHEYFRRSKQFHAMTPCPVRSIQKRIFGEGGTTLGKMFTELQRIVLNFMFQF